MINEYLPVLVQSGVAGVFVVFAVIVFNRFLDALNDMQDRFTQHLRADRRQREKIMKDSQRYMRELLSMMAAVKVELSKLSEDRDG